MTRYTVVWDKDVERSFTELWVDSDSAVRAILTEAADWVDRNLATAPESKGLWRADLNVRVLVIPTRQGQVSVVYQVVPEDRQVRVLRLIMRL